jgi:hypothetical protein
MTLDRRRFQLALLGAVAGGEARGQQAAQTTVWSGFPPGAGMP